VAGTVPRIQQAEDRGDREARRGVKHFNALHRMLVELSPCQRARQELTEEVPMTLFVIAALTVTATIWAITEPKSSDDLNEMADLVVLGFVP
jgi:hypothetical protein